MCSSDPRNRRPSSAARQSSELQNKRPQSQVLCETSLSEEKKVETPKEPLRSKVSPRPEKAVGKKPKNDLMVKFPAIRQLRFTEDSKEEDYLGFPVSYHLPHSMYYDAGKISILSKYHPCTLTELHRYNCYNEHPLCAAFRSIAEAHVITCIQREAKDKGISHGKVLDVGGSVNRHYGNKNRPFIHNCVPHFEAKDLLRRFSLKGENYCRHFWKECACHNFLASMSIHSLYYVKPDEILRNLLTQKIPVHYAVMHRYPESMGTIMHGEMSYTKSPCGEHVKVYAAGNSVPYQHSSMKWLDVGHYIDRRGTLAWELERKFEDVCVYRFVATKEVHSTDRDIEVIDENDAVIDSVLNKSFRVAEEMNAKNRKAFLDRVLRYAKDKNLSVPRLIARADSYYAEQDSILQVPGVKFWSAAFVRKAALQMAWPSAYHTYQLIFLLITAFFMPLLGFTGVEYVYVPLFFFIFYFCVSGSILIGGLTNGFLDLLWLSSLYIAVSAQVGGDFGIAQWSGETRFNETVKFLAAVMTLFKYGKRLNLSLTKYGLYDYCCAGMKLRPFSKRKIIKYTPKEPEHCVPGLRARPFVFCPEFVPMIPRNCDHNYLACIQHKVLAETPENFDFHVDVPPFIHEIGSRVNLNPLTFDEWVSRFPSKKEKRLRREYEELKDHYFGNEINDSSLFLKAEFYSEQKPPRPIHSSNVVLNFRTGRWLVPLAEILSKELPDHIMFPLHSDSYRIGQFAQKFMQNRKVMCDFSQFDSTQHERALKLIGKALRILGIPAKIVDLMLLDIEWIKVRTRRGHKYVCRGLRVSGRSETLLGNTILTLMIFFWACPEALAILVKGDDVVIFLPPNVDPAEVEARVSSQGFITKFKVCDWYDLEFCSSYFMPTSAGLMLTPKPGKMLAKTFWCKNTNYSEKDMQAQFASILKGLTNNFGYLPFLNSLYNTKCYLDWFDKVEPYYQDYNEYTDVQVSYTDETISWLQVKYDVSYEELCELGTELCGSLPIVLRSSAARKMITEDWGEPNSSDLLTVSQETKSDVTSIVILAWAEELARSCEPWLVSLVFGLYESYHSGSLYNLYGHLLLAWIMVTYGFGISLLCHILHNLFLVSRDLKQLSMVQKSKKQMRNEINSLKGQLKSNSAPKSNKSSRRRNRRSKQKSNGLRAHASMLADPCKCDLQPGLLSTDEGILAKLKTTLTPGTAYTSGYVIWCPHYAGDKANNKVQCVGYVTNLSNTGATNTVPLPAFAGTWGDNNGTAINVGATSFVQSSTVSDFRLISSCMRVGYTGQMTASAGQIAYIENLSADTALLGNGGSPCSVDQLFNLSSHVERLGVDMHENKYRPNSTIVSTFKSDRDAVYSVGDGASVTSATSESLRFSPTFFGFAWKGAASDSLFFEFYQNIEWRPEVGSGYVSSVPRQLKPAGYLDTVLKYLDDNYPGWTTSAIKGSSFIAGKVARMAFAGSYGPRSIEL